jgi:hypothetical protein
MLDAQSTILDLRHFFTAPLPFSKTLFWLATRIGFGSKRRSWRVPSVPANL